MLDVLFIRPRPTSTLFCPIYARLSTLIHPHPPPFISIHFYPPLRIHALLALYGHCKGCRFHGGHKADLERLRDDPCGLSVNYFLILMPSYGVAPSQWSHIASVPCSFIHLPPFHSNDFSITSLALATALREKFIQLIHRS